MIPLSKDTNLPRYVNHTDLWDKEFFTLKKEAFLSVIYKKKLKIKLSELFLCFRNCKKFLLGVVGVFLWLFFFKLSHSHGIVLFMDV